MKKLLKELFNKAYSEITSKRRNKEFIEEFINNNDNNNETTSDNSISRPIFNNVSNLTTVKSKIEVFDTMKDAIRYSDNKYVNNELTVEEFLLLNYLQNKPINISLPIKYNLFNLNSKINHFKKLGYIEISKDVKVSLNLLKIPELKEILKENDLKVGGKKEELIERILGNVDYYELEEKYSIEHVKLTEKGEKSIKYDYAYIFMEDEWWNNKEITKMIYKTRQSLPSNFRYSDVLWGVFNELFIKKSKDITTLKNVSLARFELLKKEKRYELALLHLLVFFRFEISGNSNNKLICRIEWLTTIYAASLFYHKLKELFKECYFELEKIEENIKLTEPYLNSLDFNYFNTEEAFKIIKDLIDTNDKHIEFKSYNYKKLDNSIINNLKRKGYYIDEYYDDI